MRRLLLTTALLLALAAGASAPARAYVIRGHGNGHGVGLSQWGAYGYARHGWSYDRILRHYYRGTSLGSARGSVRVRLESGRGTIAFAGATRAGGRRLRASRTYTARLGGGGIVLSSGRHRVAVLSSPLRVSSSRGTVRLGGRALNGVI